MTIAYGQSVYSAKAKAGEEKVSFTAKNVTAHTDGLRILLSKDVTISVNDKLTIHADSAMYDREKMILMTYGTKDYTFKGAVTVNVDYDNICEYHIGKDMLVIK